MSNKFMNANVDKIARDKAHDQYYEKRAEQTIADSSYDKDLFDLGEYCYNNPEKMKELDEKILNARSFIRGYDRAK